MSDHLDDVSVASLRRHRDEQLQKGQFGPAEHTQRFIDDKLDGEADETAALSAGRTERLHAPIDDVEELEKRQSRAEYCGFDRLAEDYASRINEITPDEEPSDAALEEQTRAALAEPSPEVGDRAAAALGSDDAVQSTERGQTAAQYLFDRYGIDSREFSGEYELRDAVRDAEPRRLDTPDDGVSMEYAALSLADRAALDGDTTPAADFIRQEYNVEPEDFEDVEALRDAIAAAGGYDEGTGETPEQFTSALSANLDRDRRGSGD